MFGHPTWRSSDRTSYYHPERLYLYLNVHLSSCSTAGECKLYLVSSWWRRVMRTQYSAARRDRGGHRPTLATTSPGICQISKLRFGTGKRARCRSLRTVASVCMTRCRGRPRDLVTAMVIRFLGNLFCPNVKICCDLVCFFSEVKHS